MDGYEVKLYEVPVASDPPATASTWVIEERPRGADPRIELATAPESTTQARVLTMALTGCAVALLLGSRPLLTWTEALPDNRLYSLIHPVVEGWHDMAMDLELTRLDDELGKATRAIEKKTFLTKQSDG
jgi:hypothetical protein